METRRLGHTDLHLTVIGLGTWAMGGGDWTFGWGPQETQDSLAAVHAAADAGINWIDTAAVYGLGKAEEVVGRALREIQRPLYVATKCGLVWDDQGRIDGRLQRKSVLAECDASLRRLRVDVIDLYQIHWPRPDDQIEEGWEAMLTLVERGKIRYAGVSNFSVEQLERVGRHFPVASLQPPYHMLKRDIESDLLPYCAQHHIGVVAYSPMARGLLTGKVTADWVAELPDTDHRKRDPLFQPPLLTEALSKVERLRPIAKRLGCPCSQLAVAWVLRRPEVTSAIVGGRTAAQVRDNALAAAVRLSAADIDEVESVLSGAAPS